MASALAVQVCRVIAPEKLSDRLLASGIFRAEGNSNLNNQVILAYLFEVNRPWFASSTLLPTLTTTLDEEWKKLDPKSPLDDQFEVLLRNINQALNHISEEGETDWIGTLNGIIMVLSGEEIHFSQTGRFPAYLLQNNRIRQITDDPQANQEPHPLRTFSNLASGHLLEGDQLLFANQELYNEISLDALRRIITNSSPLTSSQTIARELKREKKPNVSTLIIKIENPSALPNPAEAEEVSLEEVMQGVLKKLSKKVAPVISKAQELSKKATQASLEAAKQTQTTVKEKVAPKAADMVKKSIEKFKTEEKEAAPDLELPTTSEISPEEPAPPTKPVVEIISSKNREHRIHLDALASAAEARLEQPEGEVNKNVIQSSFSRTDFLASLNLFFKKTLPTFLEKVFIRLLIWFKVNKNRRIAALVTGILLIVITLSLALRHHASTPAVVAKQQNVTLLATVTSLQNKIAAAIKQNQPIVAEQDATEAIQDLNTIQSPSSDQQKEAITLWNSINSLVDPITTTSRLTSTTSYPLSAEAQGFITSLPYFFAWDGSNTLFRTGQGDVSQVQAHQALPVSGDTITSLASTNENNVAGYVLTHDNHVYRLLQNGTNTNFHEIVPQSGGFASGSQLVTFNTNLYILDSTNGLFWKYVNNGTQYAKGVSVIDINKYDIKGSVSVAIDGSLYFLKPDGSVMKFTSGKQDNTFELKNAPYAAQHPIRPTQIITDETMDDIYILDAGSTSSTYSTARIYEYDKTGTYIKQYAFPSSDNSVTGFSVDPKSKKLWLLNGSSIQEFTIS